MLLSEAIQLTGVEVYDYLDRDAAVPQIDRSCTQGDVSVLRVTLPAATTPLPRAGVVLVRSEASSHTHSIHGVGCFYDAVTSEGVELGRLTVPDGTSVLLSHPEHGGFEILPGTYRLGRQRDYAGEWAYVAD